MGPPPPPPPAPKALTFSESSVKKPSAPNRGDLLKEIRNGRALKETQTVDRSSPLLAPIKNEFKSQTQSSESSVTRLPGIGGLFADGIPTLKRTKGGITTGRANITEHNFEGSQTTSNAHSNHKPIVGSSTNSVTNETTSLKISNGDTQFIGRSNGETKHPPPPPKPGRLPPKPPFLTAKPPLFLLDDNSPLRHTTSTPSVLTQSSHRLLAKGEQHQPQNPISQLSESQSMVQQSIGKSRPCNAPPPPPPSSNKPPHLRAKSFNSKSRNEYLGLVSSSKDDNEYIHRTLPRRPVPAPPSGGKRAMKPPSMPPPPPPPPITPRVSTPPNTKTLSRDPENSFESRFLSKFKPIQFLPVPEPFTSCPKTYPSRHAQQPSSQSSGNKRAPAPLPPKLESSSRSVVVLPAYRY